MELLKDRLAWAMTTADPPCNQAELARVCRVKPPSVNDWLSGETKSMKSMGLLLASKRLGVTPEWLSTGRGQPRLNDSGPTTAADDLRPVVHASQTAILDPDTLRETLMLLAHDEGHAGPYIALDSKVQRIVGLYARVYADGGRLNKRHNAEFEAEVRQRAKGVQGGDELAKRRRQSAKRRS